jgi:hypothetical protein
MKSYLLALLISFIVATPISILWVYLIDKSNKILEQDEKDKL